MKIGQILFIFVAYALFKAMVIVGTDSTAATLEFPEMETPSIEFVTLPDNCGGFVDCIEFVGRIIVNLVLGVVYVINLIINILIYVGRLIGVILALAIAGVDGAPGWINLLLTAPLGLAIGVIIYKLIRSGESND